MLDERSGAETTGARETPAVATHSVRPDQPERPPLAVSDADVRRAWFAFYERPKGFEHIQVLPPEHPSVYQPELTLAALRRVLEADRAHVHTTTTGATE